MAEEKKCIQSKESDIIKKSESCCINHDNPNTVNTDTYNTITQSLKEEIEKQKLICLDAKQAKMNTFRCKNVNEIYLKIKKIIFDSSINGFIEVDIHTSHLMQNNDPMNNIWLHSVLTILTGEGYYIEQYPMNNTIVNNENGPVFKISWR